MQLRIAHQILIASAIVCAVLLALRAAYMFGRGGTTGDLVVATVAVVAALALTAYLRKVRAKWAAKPD